MAIYRIDGESIAPVEPTTFKSEGLKERGDLQRLLRDHIQIVAPDVLIIAEEFGEWSESRRRIDLLGIDKSANLVVIELKRTEDGGHMELQAVRYAAMVSTLTAARAVEIFESYLENREQDEDAEDVLLEFLDWEKLDEDIFGQDVRIVLVSADFSRELTTSVIWLNEKELDIRCVRIRPYSHAGTTLIDVEQVIPLPEATEYQVQVQEKKRKERGARTGSADYTRYDITMNGRLFGRQWKRNSILIVVKRLIEKGVSPLEIGEQLRPIRGNRTWIGTVGETDDPEEFRIRVSEELAQKGKKYDDRRWHTKPGDLICAEGRTYALSNQWGRTWHEAMKKIQKQYPDIRLEWSPSGDTG